MDKDMLIAEIAKLKEQRRAIILAHYYQVDEVQEAADIVGDSLELAQIAASTEAEIIVLCGVRFMAESAAILAPDKVVLLPEPAAGCPLADAATARAVRAARHEYPDAAVVCYVNSSAETKAESDICCTSANAIAVVNSLPNKQVIFLPDGNLAAWVARHSDKQIVPWYGNCYVHHNLKADDVRTARERWPQARVAVHPECRAEVLDAADYVGSTSGIRRYAQASEAEAFVIGTETGMLRSLRLENPGKQFHVLSDSLICRDMKLGGLEQLKNSLATLSPRVTVEGEIAEKARVSLARMLQVGSSPVATE